MTLRKINTCRACRRTKRHCNKARPRCSLCVHLQITCEYISGTTISEPTADAGNSVLHPGAKDRGSWNYTKKFDSLVINTSLLESGLQLGRQGTFWALYLPQEQQQQSSTIGDIFSVGPRVSELQALASHHGPAQSALQACALTVIGRRRNDSSLLQKGMWYYGDSIRQLKKSLAFTDIWTLKQAISACQLLCMYEMIRPIHDQNQMVTQGLAWRSHAMATCALADMLIMSPSLKIFHVSGSFDAIHRLAFRVNFSSRQEACLKGVNQIRPVHSIKFGHIRKVLNELMVRIPLLFARNDALIAEVKNAPRVEEVANLKLKAHILLEDFMALGQDFCQWEQRLMDLDAAEHFHNLRGRRRTLFEMSRDYGYGFLLSLAEYWASRAILNLQMASLLYEINLIFQIDVRLPDWMQPILSFVADVAHSADLLLSAQAGLWVSEQVCVVIVTAMNILAALEAVNGSEMALILSAIEKNQQGQIAFTRDFLRSITRHDDPSPKDRIAGATKEARQHGSLECFGGY